MNRGLQRIAVVLVLNQVGLVVIHRRTFAAGRAVNVLDLQLHDGSVQLRVIGSQTAVDLAGHRDYCRPVSVSDRCCQHVGGGLLRLRQIVDTQVHVVKQKDDETARDDWRGRQGGVGKNWLRRGPGISFDPFAFLN